VADIREQIVIDNMGARLFRAPAWGRAATGLKLAVRRVVIATGRTPLRVVYDAIYRAHVWYGVRAIRRLPGVRAVYVTRGLASGDVVPGVSDVDFAIFGDWSDEEHATVAAALRRLSATSPLFERELWREARTVSSIRALYDSDYSLMCRLDEGRMRWILKYGEDVLAELPSPGPDRAAGGYYMEVRHWWSYFTRTAFGTGVLATDTAFRNSLCYKVVSETAAKVHALSGDPVEPLRRKALAAALDRAPAADRPFLERLQRSASRHHTRFDGDIHDETFGHLLATLDPVQAALAAVPAFHPVRDAASARIDAPGHELLRARGLDALLTVIVAHVRQGWPGYRAAFALPCLSCYAPDDLVLLIDVDPVRRPSVADIRMLLALRARQPPITQRVTLMLLAGNGAYQIEPAGPLDLWRLVMCRASNPDIFDLASRPDYAIDGTARAGGGAPVWTRFAAALVAEELAVRRNAAARMPWSPGVSLPALDVLRNVWRHLQLEAIDDSSRRGTPGIPLTLPAIARALAPDRRFDPSLLAALAADYARALDGAAVTLDDRLSALMRAARDA
jgi:hypothetical protein